MWLGFKCETSFPTQITFRKVQYQKEAYLICKPMGVSGFLKDVIFVVRLRFRFLIGHCWRCLWRETVRVYLSWPLTVIDYYHGYFWRSGMYCTQTIFIEKYTKFKFRIRVAVVLSGVLFSFKFRSAQTSTPFFKV